MPIRHITGVLLILAAAHVAVAQSNPARQVDHFTITFTFGWTDDMMPTDPVQFDSVMAKIAAGHFSTVLCNWDSWRLPIIASHGMDYMVNMYGDDPYNILTNPQTVYDLAATLKDDEDVWGYLVNMDLVDTSAATFSSRLDGLHAADPNHPGLTSFQGYYPWNGTLLNDPDNISYYYYIWSRDFTLNFYYLNGWRNAAMSEGVPLHRMPESFVGVSLAGMTQRNRYTAFTSLAYGVKGLHWFLGQFMMDPNSYNWTTAGVGIQQINADVMAMGDELMRLQSTAVYSTIVTADAKGDAVTPGLPYATVAIPGSHWVQVSSGEVILGMFDDQSAGETFMVSNHRAHQTMDVTLDFDVVQALVQYFDVDTAEWEDLHTSFDVTSVSFTLAEGDGVLIRATENVMLGDINLDGKVDLQDFSQMKLHYSQGGGWAQGDINRDFSVDLQDFALLKAFYGQFQTPEGSASVPEPATAALLTAIAGCVLARRRRRAGVGL